MICINYVESPKEPDTHQPLKQHPLQPKSNKFGMFLGNRPLHSGQSCHDFNGDVAWRCRRRSTIGFNALHWDTWSTKWNAVFWGERLQLNQEHGYCTTGRISSVEHKDSEMWTKMSENTFLVLARWAARKLWRSIAWLTSSTFVTNRERGPVLRISFLKNLPIWVSKALGLGAVGLCWAIMAIQTKCVGREVH